MRTCCRPAAAFLLLNIHSVMSHNDSHQEQQTYYEVVQNDDNGITDCLQEQCWTPAVAELNCDRRVATTHSAWHDSFIETVFWKICCKVQTQWLEAVIDSRIATTAALQAAQKRYNEHGRGKFGNIAQRLRAAASESVSEGQLSTRRAQQLLSIFGKGSAAIELVLLQRSISSAEVDFMLQLNPDTATELTARSLGRNEESSCGEFSDVSSTNR